MEDYKEVNRAAWNEKTTIHYTSEFYENEAFIAGKTSLKEIELGLLKDLKNKRLLHLQCHFGQDTISLGKLGAIPTGVDISDAAIEKAIELNKIVDGNATFIRSDIYDLPNNLDEQFDVIFMSYGTIGWLPDINKWASIVDHFLKPGGQFLIVDFHPVIWMYDDDFTKVTYRYFNSEPIVEVEEGTYADQNSSIAPTTISWNHGLSEIITALLNVGIQLVDFQEYDYSPYDCFRHLEQVGESRYRTTVFGDKVPMVYSILGKKKS